MKLNLKSIWESDFENRFMFSETWVFMWPERLDSSFWGGLQPFCNHLNTLPLAGTQHSMPPHWYYHLRYSPRLASLEYLEAYTLVRCSHRVSAVSIICSSSLFWASFQGFQSRNVFQLAVSFSMRVSLWRLRWRAFDTPVIQKSTISLALLIGFDLWLSAWKGSVTAAPFFKLVKRLMREV